MDYKTEQNSIEKVLSITPIVNSKFDFYWWKNYDEYYNSLSGYFLVDYDKLDKFLDKNFIKINQNIYNNRLYKTQEDENINSSRVTKLFIGKLNKHLTDKNIYLTLVHYNDGYEYSFNYLNSEDSDDLVTSLEDELLECSVKESKNPAIDLIIEDPYSGLILKKFFYNLPEMDVELNYGKKWSDIHDKLVEELSKEGKAGITLLHGIPGTGKSMYIRYLSYLISDKRKIIYVPNNLVNALTTPAFITLLTNNPNSVLIIEDAEEVLKSRDENGYIVDKILNISDGILSDFLGIHILCTYNNEKDSIDSALLRKGRLTVKYEFEKLDLENSIALAKKLNIDEDRIKNEITEPKTLAEIYAMCSVELNTSFTLPEKRKSIGFNTY